MTRAAGAALRPDPEGLACEARTWLRAGAAHWPAQRATRFFKPWERVYTLGITTPDLRAMLRVLHGRVRGAWGYREAVRFAELMLRERSVEARVLGIELLGRFRRQFQPALLARIRVWLTSGRCDNWALTDDLCAAVLAPLLRANPRGVSALHVWTRSRSMWLRRAAAVALVPLARHGERLDAAYRVVTALLGDAEDLIHKAAGWLLREAGKTDPARLEAYLVRRHRALPRTTLRYAIERFPDARRRRLMKEGGRGRSVGRSRAAR